MGFADALQNDVIDHLLLTASWTQPSNIYVALFDGDPFGAGSELTGGNYARVQHEAWNAASGGDATNNGAIEFPTASSAWDEATHFALFDASSGGNMLLGDALDTPKTVQSGDTARFADGEITVTLERAA